MTKANFNQKKDFTLISGVSVWEPQDRSIPPLLICPPLVNTHYSPLPATHPRLLQYLPIFQSNILPSTHPRLLQYLPIFWSNILPYTHPRLLQYLPIIWSNILASTPDQPPNHYNFEVIVVGRLIGPNNIESKYWQKLEKSWLAGWYEHWIKILNNNSNIVAFHHNTIVGRSDFASRNRILKV